MARALAVVAIVLIALCLMGADKWPETGRTRVELPEDLGLTTCPAGDGPPFEHVRVVVTHGDDEPMAGLPSSLFSLEVGGNVTATPVDEETDENGVIRFSMVGNESFVRLGDDWLHVKCTFGGGPTNKADSLHVNSFDLNADGCVDDKDVDVFQSLYLTDDPRADFNWDGIVNMSDASVLADHNDNHCEKKEEELDPTKLPAPDKIIKADPPVRKTPIADDED